MVLNEKARELAREIHHGHIRKSNGMGYFDAHLDPVGCVLKESGYDDLTIAAGYLHDTLEDRGGEETERKISELDERLLPIIRELSEDKAGTWDERKDSVVAHISTMSNEAAAVKAADVLSNLRGCARDGYGKRDTFWKAFKVDREKSIWFYRSCIDKLLDHRGVSEAMKNELVMVFGFVSQYV